MKIFTFDTTLRDGTQGEAVSFSVDDKLIIAQKLDELGIDYIEGGHSLSEFLDDFPTVPREIVIAALEQAKAHLIADARAT